MPTILKNISSYKAIFNNNSPLYICKWVIENLGYQKDLPPSNRVRQRDMIWFDPPYSVNVEMNFGKKVSKTY